jgi:hypothetical protein
MRKLLLTFLLFIGALQGLGRVRLSVLVLAIVTLLVLLAGCHVLANPKAEEN